MKKKIFIFFYLLFTITYLLLPKISYAKDPNFDISVESVYVINSDGLTEITQTISINNKTEFYFTPTYTVSVGFKDIQEIQAYNSDGTIPTTLDNANPDNKKIKLTFPKRYAGLGKTNIFTLRFATHDIAKKQGSIWEVSIPGIATVEDFKNYTAKIQTPVEFGSASIIKPKIKQSTKRSLLLTKDEIGKSGVSILYGQRQYYAFSLKYNISNPNLFPVKTEIALPPQTNYQNVVVSTFSIAPTNVTRDPDGNWIAEYRLLPQQKKEVVVKGYVEVLSTGSEEILTSKQIKEYTSSKKHWTSNDAKIIEIARTLKTPQEIYDFVVEKLTYNYSKIATDNLRLGSVGALFDPKNSVCLEFTDLFISIARAKRHSC